MSPQNDSGGGYRPLGRLIPLFQHIITTADRRMKHDPKGHIAQPSLRIKKEA